HIIAANKLRTTFDRVLNELLSKYKSDDPTARVEFVHDISITQELTNTAYMKSDEEISDLLFSNIRESDVYQIQKEFVNNSKLRLIFRNLRIS
ncbi:MAG: hypothetical protein IKK40_08150, partial [Bacteroidales bacterium]|nr:hypothetical protein [Bacteroidales bacterium]